MTTEQEPRWLFVGGPMDGEWTATRVQVVTLEAYPGMAYVKTRPSSWEPPPSNWFEMGLPEPVVPDKVFEWHDEGWESPAVAGIRAALREASDV